MQWNGFAARFGLSIPKASANTRAKDVDLHEKRIDISPCEGNKLRAPQTRTPPQNHYRFDAKWQFVHQRRDLGGSQYIWLPQPLRRSPDLGDGVAVCPFIPDRMIEDGGHDVPNLALRCWSIGQRMQPLFDFHCSNI